MGYDQPLEGGNPDPADATACIAGNTRIFTQSFVLSGGIQVIYRLSGGFPACVGQTATCTNASGDIRSLATGVPALPFFGLPLIVT